MERKYPKSRFFTRPEEISKYLSSLFRNWGYFVTYNRSDDSESLYLKVCTGTREEPKALHIRISDHSVPPNKRWIVFQADVYCSYEREGATNYVKLITKLAEELNKPLPKVLEKMKAGTPLYKRYRIEMQCRKKKAGRNRRLIS